MEEQKNDELGIVTETIQKVRSTKKTKEETNEYMRAYREKNRSKLRDYFTEYRKKNNDKLKSYMKTYRKENPEKYRSYQKTRRLVRLEGNNVPNEQ